MEIGAVVRALSTITDQAERGRAIHAVVSTAESPHLVAAQLLQLLTAPSAPLTESETATLLLACELVMESPDQVKAYLHTACFPLIASISDAVRPSMLQRRAARSVAALAGRLSWLLEELLATAAENLSGRVDTLPLAATTLLLESLVGHLSPNQADPLLRATLQAAREPRAGAAASAMVGRLVPKLLQGCADPSQVASECWQSVCRLWDSGKKGQSLALLGGTLDILVNGPLDQSGVGGTEPAALWAMLPEMVEDSDPLLRKHALHVLRALARNCSCKKWSATWTSWIQLHSTFQEAVLHLTKAVWPDMIKLIDPHHEDSPQLPMEWTGLLVRTALANPNVHVRKFAALHLLEQQQLALKLPPALVFGALFDTVNASHLLHQPRASIQPSASATAQMQPRDVATAFFRRYAEPDPEEFVQQMIGAVYQSKLRHDVLLFYLELLCQIGTLLLPATSVQLVAQILRLHVAASAPALRAPCWRAAVQLLGRGAANWNIEQLLLALQASAVVPAAVWRGDQMQRLMGEWNTSARTLVGKELYDQLLGGRWQASAACEACVVARAAVAAADGAVAVQCAAEALDGAHTRAYADQAKLLRAVQLVHAAAECSTRDMQLSQALDAVSEQLVPLIEQTARHVLANGCSCAEELEFFESQLLCARSCCATSPSAAFSDTAQRLLRVGASAVATVGAGPEHALLGLLVLECAIDLTVPSPEDIATVLRSLAAACELPLARLPSTLMAPPQLRSRLLMLRFSAIKKVAVAAVEMEPSVRTRLWSSTMDVVEELHGSFAVPVFEAVAVLADDGCDVECVQQLTNAVWLFVTESTHKSAVRSTSLATAISRGLYREAWLLRPELQPPLSALLEQILTRKDKLPVLLGEVVVQTCAVFAASPAAATQGWVATLSLLCRCGPPGDNDDPENPTFRADHAWVRAIVNKMLHDIAPAVTSQPLVHGLAQELLTRDSQLSASPDCCKLGHEHHREQDCVKLQRQLRGHPQNSTNEAEDSLCSFRAIFETIPSGNKDLAGEGIPPSLFDSITAALKGATSVLGSHAPANCPTSNIYTLEPTSATSADAGADFQTKISPWEESCFDSRDEAHLNKQRQQLVVVASCIDKIPNLAGIARTSEIFNLSKLVLHSKKVAQDKLFQQCSVTAEKWLPIEEVPEHQLERWLVAQKELGWSIVALEQTANSVCITKFQFPEKCIVVLGEEQRGVPVELIKLVDTCVEIPQLGVLRSLNVHVSASLMIWEFSKQRHFAC